jgi:uncharacterized Zn-binding protein involved in type VI secretion
MSNILRKNIDFAGGLIVTGSPNVFVNGASVVRIGDTVNSHGDHSTSSMITGSSKVFVNGVGLCRAGDVASCGDYGTGGSPNTFAG